MNELGEMKLKDLLFQIESIKDNSQAFLPDDPGKIDDDNTIWKDDVDACTALIEIVKVFRSKGCNTVDDAIKYISEVRA